MYSQQASSSFNPVIFLAFEVENVFIEVGDIAGEGFVDHWIL